jgi:hypothetical protein
MDTMGYGKEEIQGIQEIKEAANRPCETDEKH